MGLQKVQKKRFSQKTETKKLFWLNSLRDLVLSSVINQLFWVYNFPCIFSVAVSLYAWSYVVFAVIITFILIIWNSADLLIKNISTIQAFFVWKMFMTICLFVLICYFVQQFVILLSRNKLSK